MDSEKQVLRSAIRRSRREARVDFDALRLSELPEFQDANVIASYYSYGDEPSTHKINTAILAAGKTLLLPRLLPDNDLEFAIWDGETTKLLIQGRTYEPSGPAYTGKIDLLILPSLAVDESGNRIGQGGGSYDRVLAKVKTFTLTLIAPNELLNLIPTQPHDRKVDAALLPDRIIRF